MAAIIARAFGSGKDILRTPRDVGMMAIVILPPYIRRMRTLASMHCAALLLAAIPTSAAAQCPDGSPGRWPAPCGVPAKPVPLDSQAVVLIPFAVRGPPAVAYLGSGMVDLFHIPLDAVGVLRVVHPPTARRQLRSLRDSTDVVAAAPVSVRLGARYVLGGVIVAVGNELRLTAELYDAVRRQKLVAVSGVADESRLPAVVDSLATALMLRAAPAQRSIITRDQGAYITRSSAALQAYLAAERFIRTGDWRSAADSLKQSIQHDRDFGWPYMALIRVMGAHQAFNFGISAADLADSANARLSKFPPRIRGLIIASRLQARGQRKATIDLANDLARAYPNDGDVAFRQADAYYHFGINLGEDPRRVLRLLERAVELDPQQETYDHYVGMLAEVRDTLNYWRVVREHRLSGEEPFGRLVLREEDPARVLDPSAFQGAAGAYAIEGGVLRYLADHDPARAVRITDSIASLVLTAATTQPPRIYELIRRSQLAIASGRYDDAWRFLDQVRVTNPNHPGVKTRTILYSLITGQRDEAAAALARQYRDTLRALDQLSPVLLWSAAKESVDSARALIDRAITVAGRNDSVIARAIMDGMHGLVALRQGDSAGARAALLRAREVHTRRIGVPSALWPSLPFTLTLVRLDLAVGDANAAKLHLADAYPGHETMLYYPDIEELRARVCEALRDIDCAIRAHQNVIKLLERADSTVAPRRIAAQTALARLVRP